jgi:DNA-binding HxlR family transcriptional regulator
MLLGSGFGVDFLFPPRREPWRFAILSIATAYYMKNHLPGAVASEIILALDPRAHNFASLLRKIRVSDAVVTAALSELISTGFVKRFGAKFALTDRGFDLVCACRPRRARNRRH